MIPYLSDSEVRDSLKSLTVLVDSREKQNEHVTSYFEKKNVSYLRRKLDVGDYSCMLGDQTLALDVAIERKHNLDELAGNLTAERDRFEREFLRAKALGTKVFLLIENASWNDVFLQNYRSQLSASAMLASLLSWQVRYNVTIVFTDERNSPALIHQLLVYFAREELLYGSGTVCNR